MRSIFKYPIPIEDRFQIPLPQGAEILSFALQNNTPCIWALIDPNALAENPREFRIIGTGHPIEDEDLKFIGTVLMHSGSLVWHLFEVIYA